MTRRPPAVPIAIVLFGLLVVAQLYYPQAPAAWVDRMTVLTVLLFLGASMAAAWARSGPRFALCLAGHTHGGQVALFGFALWTPRGSGNFTAGRYDSTMCPIYVSRGIGTSILPIRLGARPEIAVFTL